jgi:arabinofuranosyltransferase
VKTGADKPGARDATRLVAVVLLLAAAVLFVRRLVQVWPFFVDDAFITLRYASNLASGLGPNFNPPPPRVEGYTSFLWVLAGAIPHRLGLDAALFVKILGTLFAAGLLGASFLLVYRWSGFLEGVSPALPAALTVFMLAGFHPTEIHAVSGMETALAALLLVLLVHCAVNLRHTRGVLFAPLLGLLLGLTRPEANLVILPILVFCYVYRDPKRRRRFVVAVAGLYLLPGAGYFLWRALYYGRVLPIPFNLKVTTQEWLAGKHSALSFVQMVLIHAGVLGAFSLLRMRKEVVLVAGVAGVWVLFCLLPAPIMDYQWRFCFPTAALFFALGAYGFAVLLSRLPRFSGRLCAFAVVLVVALSLGAGFAKSAEVEILDRRAYGLALTRTHVRLGKILGRYPGRDGRTPTIALGDAGAVPYYSHWRVIDTCGLNEPAIGTTGRHDPDFVFDQRPDLVVLASRRKDKYEAHPSFPWEQSFFDAAGAHGYSPLAILTFSVEYHLWIFGRSGSDAAVFLQEQLSRSQQGRPEARGRPN